MSKLKDATMIDATEERKNRFNGESYLLTPHEAKIHDEILSTNYKQRSKIKKPVSMVTLNSGTELEMVLTILDRIMLKHIWYY